MEGNESPAAEEKHECRGKRHSAKSPLRLLGGKVLSAEDAIKHEGQENEYDAVPVGKNGPKCLAPEGGHVASLAHEVPVEKAGEKLIVYQLHAAIYGNEPGYNEREDVIDLFGEKRGQHGKEQPR